MQKLIVVATGAPDRLPDLLRAPASHPELRSYTVDVPLRDLDAPGYVQRPEVVAVVALRVESLASSLLDRLFGDLPVEAYLVAEDVKWDYERTWPDGEPSPGLKQVSFLTRRGGLTRAAFAEHWSLQHAPLAARHQSSIWRYVQNVVVERMTDGAPEVDGIAELSYRTVADWRDRKHDSPEGQAIISADIARFIDRGSLWHVIASERIVRSGG